MPAKSFIPAGQRFGLLTVVREAEPRNGRRHFTCICDCGGGAVVSLSNLRTGNSTSCGCLFRQGREAANAKSAAEGYKHHPLRSLHNGVVRRCTDPKHKDYPRYGGAGIQLYGPWRHRKNFIEDVEKEIGPRPSKQHTLDRIDTRGHYEPGNIQWATRLEQKHNQRKQWRFVSDEEAAAIRARYIPGKVSQKQVAAEFRTTQAEVSRIVNRQGRYARS